jgi:hypothetical protein
MSYFVDDESIYTYMDLWNEFYGECAGPEWDDPEYCDEMNKEKWFEQWLIDNGYLKYKTED